MWVYNLKVERQKQERWQAKPERLDLSPRATHQDATWFSQLVAWLATSSKAVTHTRWVLALEFSLLQCLNTSLVKFLSLLAMLPVRTRKRRSLPVTCSWLSAMMRNSTNWWLWQLSLKAAFSQMCRASSLETTKANVLRKLSHPKNECELTVTFPIPILGLIEIAFS